MRNLTMETLLTVIRSMLMPVTMLAGLAATPAYALESARLTDVIKSSGSGDIDVFDPSATGRVIDGQVLEAFRQDNNNQIIFAVDVNEAADGSEKASSQAVTVDTAQLLITIGGTQHAYDSYATITRTLLARKGQTNRSLYY